MPITHILAENCRLYGEETALVEINPQREAIRRVTWKEYDLIEPESTEYYRREISWNVFDEKANRVANMLTSRGIKKGDKVGILLVNCLEWLPLYFGILKTGALAVPLNFRYTSEEIAYCLNLAEVDVLIFGPEFIGRVEEIAPQIGDGRLLIFFGTGMTPSFAEDYHELTVDCSSQFKDAPLADDDLAVIYFSSGTTGRPKAILHRHKALMHACLTEQAHHGQTHEDVFLCIPPLYHTGAKMHWFGSFLVGGKGVLLKGTEPRYVLEAISHEKCTIAWLLVPWAQDILSCLDSGELHKENYHLTQWRLTHMGAQPIPRSLVSRWLGYFPHHDYDTNYGLSESIGPGCVHLGVGNEEKAGAIGIPGYNWEVKIVDESGANVSQGSVGELCVRGDGVMLEYYHNPEATQAALKDGWLYTGDMAMQDEDGFYFLVDRKKDVIISGGENIYPVQIEEFIHAHPAIKDVAVIGIPDKRLGEIACAVIQQEEDQHLTEEELQEFCTGLPRYKRPRKLIFAEVPRNPTGKIEKPKLREIYGAAHLVETQSLS